MDGDSWIASHVESIAGRTHDEGERLTGTLVGRAWPGGHEDHTRRAALDWMRRWRPAGPRLELVACGCEDGYCQVCN